MGSAVRTVLQMDSAGARLVGLVNLPGIDLDVFGPCDTADFGPNSARRARHGMGNRRRQGSEQDCKTCNPGGEVSSDVVHSHSEILSRRTLARRAQPGLSLCALFGLHWRHEIPNCIAACPVRQRQRFRLARWKARLLPGHELRNVPMRRFGVRPSGQSARPACVPRCGAVGNRAGSAGRADIGAANPL